MGQGQGGAPPNVNLSNALHWINNTQVLMDLSHHPAHMGNWRGVTNSNVATTNPSELSGR